MPVPISRLRAWVKACDPARPLDPDDPRYVDLDALGPIRGGGPRSCVDQLAHTVALADPGTTTCQLFTGYPGTGKTTELRQLARALESDPETPTHVVTVDVEEWVDLHATIGLTDVLRVLAYVLDREALVAEGGDPRSGVGYLERLRGFLQTDVNVKNLGWEDGASVLFELRDNPTFRQQLEAAVSRRFQQFAREAHEVMEQAVGRLKVARKVSRVIVLVDSLEKLTPLREEERDAVEASVERLFFVYAGWLRIPCHVVYTFPFWLSFRPALDANYTLDPVVLPAVPVREVDGGPDPVGLAALRGLVARRVDVGAVFGGPEALDPLLAASGGYPRELLRMLHELLVQAVDFPLGPADVARVIGRLAEDYASVVRQSDLPLLAAVARTHALPVGDAAETAALTRLVNGRLVLAYRSHRRWYDINPLLRDLPALQEHLR